MRKLILAATVLSMLASPVMAAPAAPCARNAVTHKCLPAVVYTKKKKSDGLVIAGLLAAVTISAALAIALQSSGQPASK